MYVDRLCTACGSFKELEQFARKQDGKQGRRSQCKKCLAEKQAIYRKTPSGVIVERCYTLSHLDKKLDRLSRWQYIHAGNPTSLARILKIRRQARLKYRRADTLEDRSRWNHKISELDQQVKILRNQRANKHAQV